MMYESIDSSITTCPWGGKPVVDYICENEMKDWLEVLLDVLDKYNVNSDDNDGCPSHLRSCAYLCYAHDSYGVAVVPTSLWKVSQKAEADLQADD